MVELATTCRIPFMLPDDKHIANRLVDDLASGDAMKTLFRHLTIGVSTSNLKNDSAATNLTTLFDKCVDPTNIYSWNVVIQDLAGSGDSVEALRAFSSLRKLSIRPNCVTFPCAVKSSSALNDLWSGKQAHGLALVFGYAMDLFVTSALVDMYCKCGEMGDAWMLFVEMPFRNVVSWTTMVNGFLQNGDAEGALRVFKEFLNEESGEEDVRVDEVALVSVLSSISRVLGNGVTDGVHGFALKRGILGYLRVGNTLMEACAKCGEVGVSRKVFNEMGERDVVSWNSMIALYAQNGLSSEALSVFKAMLNDGDVCWNEITLSAVLFAYAHSGALQIARSIHSQLTKTGMEHNMYMGTSLIDMYFKCGKVDFARETFKNMKNKNVTCWTAMVAGYGMHGLAQDAMDIFYEMRKSAVKPNYVTFVSVLAACSHAGFVEEGHHWFQAMRNEYDYDIEPGVEHYSCMVDLLGRAGRINEAYNLTQESKVKPDSVVWGSILSACRIHKNVNSGKLLRQDCLS